MIVAVKHWRYSTLYVVACVLVLVAVKVLTWRRGA